MWSQGRLRGAGAAATSGGLLGVAATPFMVMVEHSTGWSISPRPAWVEIVRPAVRPLISFASPVAPLVIYGAVYAVALVLMFVGILALRETVMERTTVAKSEAFFIVIIGLFLIIPGELLHTATWYSSGQTNSGLGLSVGAGMGFAAAMMGQNLILAGSLLLGLIGLRSRCLAPWLSCLLLAVAPGGIVLPLTLLPSTPSGSLFVFSLTMTALGYSLATGRTAVRRVRQAAA